MKILQQVPKYCGKEEKHFFPFYIIIFIRSLTSGVKVHINLCNVVVRFIFSSILHIWYVEVRISRSISESPLDCEIRWEFLTLGFDISCTSHDMSKLIFLGKNVSICRLLNLPNLPSALKDNSVLSAIPYLSQVSGHPNSLHMSRNLNVSYDTLMWLKPARWVINNEDPITLRVLRRLVLVCTVFYVFTVQLIRVHVNIMVYMTIKYSDYGINKKNHLYRSCQIVQAHINHKRAFLYM